MLALAQLSDPGNRLVVVDSVFVGNRRFQGMSVTLYCADLCQSIYIRHYADTTPHWKDQYMYSYSTEQGENAGSVDMPLFLSLRRLEMRVC